MTPELKKAIDAYPSATDEVKNFIKELFPDHNFGRVGSFEEAHPIFLKLKTKDPLYLILQKRKVEELTAHEKLMIIAEVLRDGWIADFSDSNQAKWYGWFEYESKKAGFGFSHPFTRYADTASGVGSRLSFPNRELAIYFNSHPRFLKLHNEYLLINQ